MFCKFCGGQIENGDQYCSACGARTTALRNQNINNYGANQQPPAARPDGEKNKTTFLGFVLGLISVIMLFFRNNRGMSYFSLFGFEYSSLPMIAFFGFSVTAIVLGSMGMGKKYKYSLTSLLLGIAGILIIFFNIL